MSVINYRQCVMVISVVISQLHVKCHNEEPGCTAQGNTCSFFLPFIIIIINLPHKNMALFLNEQRYTLFDHYTFCNGFLGFKRSTPVWQKLVNFYLWSLYFPDLQWEYFHFPTVSWTESGHVPGSYDQVSWLPFSLCCQDTQKSFYYNIHGV